MSFTDDIRRITVEWQGERRELVNGIAEALLTSIADGSPHTSSPGQPIDTGFLWSTWQKSHEGTDWHIATACAYAPVIEYNDRSRYDDRGRTSDKYGVKGGLIGPATEAESAVNVTRKHHKSTVGGHRSRELTLEHADKLVEQVKKELLG